MAIILTGSIDVTKIDKSKLIQGKKGTYLDLKVIINDKEDQFGQLGNIQHGQTKEERESGAAKVYLGNLKKVWSSDDGGSAKPKAANAFANPPAAPDNDLPF